MIFLALLYQLNLLQLITLEIDVDCEYACHPELDGWLKQNESAQILVLINRVRSLFTFGIKQANGGTFQLYKFSLIPIVQNAASLAGILTLGHIDHQLLLGLYEPLITAWCIVLSFSGSYLINVIEV